ncbi:sensor histidine kinase [Paenibacillus typhae]|uniref:sensor histidine kinase n=1 Tax=Paenibacillus typhae TaxID=1174501 RepID=UPI001C8E1F97|nr:sensor histidine kinase [Paenibacillus typhae]MBY0013693.1 sensor histidine kinase [Paenibacillus typhae]
MKRKREKQVKKDGMLLINELFESRLTVLIWVSIVYVSAVMMQFIRDPQILTSAVFTGVFTVHVLLHWNFYRVPNRHFWLHFAVQGILIYLCAILMPRGYQAVLIGLLPVLVAQSLAFSYRIRNVVIVSVISLVIFFDAALTLSDTEEVLFILPFFGLMLIVVVAYALLFFQQVEERLRIQTFLRDLSEAHTKVEELTLANERQRMARDLHDTLAQGVAGLIMQLEAADAHLSQGRIEKAQEITRMSMTQARRTLAEARLAIDNLRLKSAPELDFKEAVQVELQHFQDATGIEAVTRLNLTRRLSRMIMEHSLHMVKECLTNIARHARAGKVWVELSDADGRLFMEIRDNGVGFSTNTIGREPGHYGLLGLQERVRLIGGTMTVDSSPAGTRITIEAEVTGGE